MLALAGIDASPDEALASGAAERVWMAMVQAQGGDLGAGLPTAPHARRSYGRRPPGT